MTYINENPNLTESCQETDSLLSNRPVKAKKATPWHIIVPVFVLMLGIGAVMAPLVQFYTEIFCDLYYKSEVQDGGSKDDNVLFSWLYDHDQIKANEDFPDVRDCSIPEVQVVVSRVLAIVTFLQSASTFLVAGFYGSLSDRYGRKLVCQIFAIGNIATVACYLAVLIIKGQTAGILLVLAPIIRGFLVGEASINGNLKAYATDCTTPETRTLVFSRLVAAALAGVTLGPTISSLLIAKTGTLSSVFYFLLFLYIPFFVYTLFFLPESLDEATMAKARQDYANKPKATFLQKINVFSALDVLIHTKPKHISNYTLPILACILCLVQAFVQPPTLLYAMLTFHWTAYEGGLFLSASSAIRVLVITLILPFIVKRYQAFVQAQQQKKRKQSQQCHNDEDEDENTVEAEKVYYRILFDVWMIRIGLSIDTLCFILMAWATTSLWFAVFGSLQSLAILASPSLVSLFTTLVDPSQVGALLGSQAILESITTIISHTGMTLIYSASVETQPNLAFYVCSMIAGTGVLLAYLIHPVKKSTNLDP